MPRASGERMRSGIALIVRRFVVTSSPRCPSPRVAPRELTVLVHERDRGAVDLRLGDVGDGLVRVEALAHVVRPLLERLVGRHLLEEPIRVRWSTLELVGGRRAHALGRRVGADKLGILLLERLELVEEAVVVGVRDLRVVEDVVAVQVVLDLPRGARPRASGPPWMAS